MNWAEDPFHLFNIPSKYIPHVTNNVPSEVLVRVFGHTCTNPPTSNTNVKHVLPQFGHLVPNQDLDIEGFFP